MNNITYAYFLVRFSDNSTWEERNELYQLLREEGFEKGCGSGGCPWVYIDINEKLYRTGKAGVCFGKIIGDHAITFEEFKTIYGIYKKYQGLKVLELKD